MTNEPALIAEWPRNSREMVRVTLSEFKGFHMLDIREFYPEAGILRPGRKGISIPAANLRRLAVAINVSVTTAEARGWIKPEGASR